MGTPSGWRREDIVSRRFLPDDMAEVALTAGSTFRRAVESIVDLWLQGHGGGGGLTDEDRASLVAARWRTDTDEQSPTATNWSPRPQGFSAVVAVGAAPAPADAGPLDWRQDRDANTVTDVTTTFSLVDGVSWPAPWITERVPAGGGASVAAGRGVVTTGSLGASAFEDQAAIRYGSGMQTNTNVLLTFRHQSDAARPRFVLRSDVANLGANTAVRVGYDRTSLTISDIVAGTATVIATAAKTLTVGADYRLRIDATGPTVKARVWPLADPEPTGWDVTAATVAKTTAGYLGIVVAGTNATPGAAQVVQYDDITITATAAGGFGINYGAAFGA